MNPSVQSIDLSPASFSMGTTSSSGSSSLLFTTPTIRPSLKNPLRVSAERFSKEEAKQIGGSKEQRRQQIMKLKKRFLKDKEMTSSFFAKSEAQKKITREVRKDI